MASEWKIKVNGALKLGLPCGLLYGLPVVIFLKPEHNISKRVVKGVQWELGFAFFRGWEMGFCALGLGSMKKNNRKMGMGFQFEQHRLG